MENKKTTAVANSTLYTLSSKLNINQWAEEDRPREKMERLGAEALSDAELLAILVGSGSPQEDAVSLMKRILNDCNNNLNTLGKMTLRQLCEPSPFLQPANWVSVVRWRSLRSVLTWGQPPRFTITCILFFRIVTSKSSGSC